MTDMYKQAHTKTNDDQNIISTIVCDSQIILFGINKINWRVKKIYNNAYVFYKTDCVGFSLH